MNSGRCLRQWTCLSCVRRRCRRHQQRKWSRKLRKRCLSCHELRGHVADVHMNMRTAPRASMLGRGIDTRRRRRCWWMRNNSSPMAEAPFYSRPRPQEVLNPPPSNWHFSALLMYAAQVLERLYIHVLSLRQMLIEVLDKSFHAPKNSVMAVFTDNLMKKLCVRRHSVYNSLNWTHRSTQPHVHTQRDVALLRQLQLNAPYNVAPAWTVPHIWTM